MAGVFFNTSQSNLFDQYLNEKPYKVAKPYFDGIKPSEDGRIFVSEQSLNILGACLKNEPIVGMYSLYVAFSDALEARKREDREREQREQREKQRQESSPFSLTHPDNILPNMAIDSHSQQIQETQQMETQEIQETQQMENVD